MQLAHKLLSTRGGTIFVAALAALVAGGFLLVYLARYRSSVNAGTQTVTVLVAKSLIEKGTPGDVIGSQELFQPQEVAKKDLETGAITSVESLRGRIAVDDVFPNEQLTVSDFSTTTTDAIGATLAADERAVSIPVDGAHGMIGQVQAGDHVDVFGAFNVKRLNRDGTPAPDTEERPVLRLLVPDVSVIEAPGDGGSSLSGSGGSRVVLKVDDTQAANLTFASENGQLWLVLRPRAGGAPTTTKIVTLETVLFGLKPVNALGSFGGH